MKGQVIGLLNSKYVDIHYDNTAYGVPSKTIKRVINDLYYKGQVIRPTLGITITALYPEDVEKGLPFGSKVVEVQETSGAFEKLKVGDIIVKCNGQSITPEYELLDILDTVTTDNLDIVLEVYDVEALVYYTVEFKATPRYNVTGYVVGETSSDSTHEHAD